METPPATSGALFEVDDGKGEQGTLFTRVAIHHGRSTVNRPSTTTGATPAMATTGEDAASNSAPPTVGKSASVRVDQPMHDDLAVLMKCGMTASDAIRDAVGLLAGIYRNAWDVGGYPEGVTPLIESANLTAYDAVRHADQRV